MAWYINVIFTTPKSETINLVMVVITTEVHNYYPKKLFVELI